MIYSDSTTYNNTRFVISSCPSIQPGSKGEAGVNIEGTTLYINGVENENDLLMWSVTRSEL